MEMNKETKEIMERVWNDIFNNECAYLQDLLQKSRNFEDYWQWKLGEQDHIQSNIHKMLYLQDGIHPDIEIDGA